MIIFLSITSKTFVVATQKNHLHEIVLMSSHNICFGQEKINKFSKDKCVFLNGTINSDAGEAGTRNSLFLSQALYHSSDLMSH